MPSKLLVAGVAGGHDRKLLPDFVKTFIIKPSMRMQDLDIDVLAREEGVGRQQKGRKKTSALLDFNGCCSGDEKDSPMACQASSAPWYSTIGYPWTLS